MPKDPSKPWHKIYDTLPEPMADMVEKDLAEVYENMQSQASKYDPYKDIVEEYDPEQISNAIAFANALEQDPQGTFSQMAEYMKQKGLDPVNVLGIQPPSVPASASPSVDDDEVPNYVKTLNSSFEEMRQNFNNLAKFTVEKHQMEESQRQEQAFKAQLDSLEEAHKDEIFDRNYVADRMRQGRTGEQAVQDLKEIVTRFAAPKQDDNPPVVLGAGTLPSNQNSIAEMSNQQLEELTEAFIKSQHGS